MKKPKANNTPGNQYTRGIAPSHGHNCRKTIGRSPTYLTYQGMISRCTYRGNASWKNYGGRGIDVCPRWREPGQAGFRNFLSDMGLRPEGLTLDRIDNEKDYSKDNCRWATRSEQIKNQRPRQKKTVTDCFL